MLRRSAWPEILAALFFEAGRRGPGGPERDACILATRGGRDADEGDLNVARKAVRPSELRYDTTRDDSCFFSRKFSHSVAAVPPSCRSLVGHDLSNEAKFVESGD